MTWYYMIVQVWEPSSPQSTKRLYQNWYSLFSLLCGKIHILKIKTICAKVIFFVKNNKTNIYVSFSCELCKKRLSCIWDSLFLSEYCKLYIIQLQVCLHVEDVASMLCALKVKPSLVKTPLRIRTTKYFKYAL